MFEVLALIKGGVKGWDDWWKVKSFALAKLASKAYV
jgi:hypothetical protein